MVCSIGILKLVLGATLSLATAPAPTSDTTWYFPDSGGFEAFRERAQAAFDTSTPIFLEALPSSISEVDANPDPAPTYPNGDYYFLLTTDADWAEHEWRFFYSYSRWAVARGFRMILIPGAREAHIRDAVANPRTTVMVVSGHADEDGVMSGADKQDLPRDVFEKNRGTRFKLLILSVCFGNKAIERYKTPRVVYWDNETRTGDLIEYLQSDESDAAILETLGKASF